MSQIKAERRPRVAASFSLLPCSEKPVDQTPFLSRTSSGKGQTCVRLEGIPRLRKNLRRRKKTIVSSQCGYKCRNAVAAVPDGGSTDYLHDSGRVLQRQVHTISQIKEGQQLLSLSPFSSFSLSLRATSLLAASAKQPSRIPQAFGLLPVRFSPAFKCKLRTLP
ncbi:hypothetical protein ALC60_09221 [Trachymyrmex zeteki]|uniref:Uncharacterized protein n=1 Tax=Mycetomoellerius zeteki TaxID=64791 RepID=A0A151WUZ8_9HYME|nr:hypothetical protein ALC60_09221 [Trachymyrmex zeteki]